MNTRPLSENNKPPRPTVEYLIKDGLGYCCLWAFFSLFKRTTTIAFRLGVTPRAVRYHKAAFRAGEYTCESCQNCMKKEVKLKKIYGSLR